MSNTVEAIYENGVLKLGKPLPLPDHSAVLVTVHSNDVSDGGREPWLKQSETSLTKTWDNPADDVFNALLEK